MDVLRVEAGAKLVFLLHAPPAAMLGFSIGYVVKRPGAADARDAAIMIPVAFVATLATQLLGLRWIRRAQGDPRTTLIAGQLAGLLMAPVLLVMAVLVLL